MRHTTHVAGLWYAPRFDGTCYFKSTDGHTGEWTLAPTRLNLNVATLARKHGGVILVDSTRAGKVCDAAPVCVHCAATDRWSCLSHTPPRN